MAPIGATQSPDAKRVAVDHHGRTRLEVGELGLVYIQTEESVEPVRPTQPTDPIQRAISR